MMMTGRMTTMTTTGRMRIMDSECVADSECKDGATVTITIDINCKMDGDKVVFEICSFHYNNRFRNIMNWTFNQKFEKMEG